MLDNPLARMALERGGHVRVGIEDAAGRSHRSNVEMVAVAAELANEVGRRAVTGADAMAVLRSD